MNLLDFRYDKYTTTGNDGIIEKIFEILDIQNGFFVEFGAWDGIKGSNCRRLFENGWHGIFIEPESSRYSDLQRNYKDCENIVCIHSMIDTTQNTFDSVVKEHVNGTIDLCSIDIDGLDLEVFETFEHFMPTVVCIEGGQMLEPNSDRVPEYIASDNIQQSLKVMTNSFKSRGYVPICSYQDTFFVKEEYSHLFDTPTNVVELYMDGLISHYRRMPWIQMMLKRNGMRNKIIDYALQKTDYHKYGYDQRKVWGTEEEEKITSFLKQIKRKFVTK